MRKGVLIDTKTVDGMSIVNFEQLREIARILLAWGDETASLSVSGGEVDVICNFLKRTPFPLSNEHLPAMGAALLAHRVDLLHQSCGYQLGGCEREEARQWIRPLAIFVALFLVALGAVYGIGQRFLGQREQELQNNLQELVALTCPEGSLELDQIETLLKAKDLYPLVANTPKLSDLLVWLSGIAENIELSSLQYSLVKRPDKTKPKEHYQVKVDMEFTAESATDARKFHQQLLAPNPFIDPKSEVKWSLTGGKWRASFFLKDKTVYFP